jgi:adenylylsulfate kinase-like enzyme
MSHVVLLTGLPGTGKLTVARELVRRNAGGTPALDGHEVLTLDITDVTPEDAAAQILTHAEST